MFFAASIAFFLSVSGIAQGAPTVKRDGTVPLQVCTGVSGTGSCTPLNFVFGNSEGVSNDPASCTNVSGAHSLIMDISDDCTLLMFPNCVVGLGVDDIAREIFQSDDITNDLPGNVQSISCQRVPGLVNGLFPDQLPPSDIIGHIAK
ncbi:hypothetical protein B0H19DRAFT_1142962 [Mycena capillaripes]|nr:hypothetical protein B0H19DRAFT_1142962 [Mycena capillaripes]